MSVALVFPGQGSQAVGMGKDFIEQFASARLVMEEADEVLKQKLTKLILEGPQDTLTLTENTQPALLAISIAILRTLEQETGKPAHQFAKYVAGHSLGEYSAHCAAGTFSLADALRLVRLRGEAMQKAVPVGKGSMAAILGLEIDQVESLLTDLNSETNLCVVANDNSPGQVVISGHTAAVEEANAKATEAGAKRALLLPVSAPFHSPLMEPAANVMKEALSETSIQHPKIEVIANITSMPIQGKEFINEMLVKQITGRVRWRESVQHLAQLKAEHVIEIGAGKVLTGLNKRIDNTLNAFSINNPSDMDEF
ncbi:MAG: ACP S-malonyltransferase, partial [Alphaproteobacteria bacterium]|nr:ACP S-malonyltransferase [Alphaproteobacteria bacterium]